MKTQLRALSALVSIFLVCFSAGAISRSGGGKIESFKLGFETESPTDYPRANPVVNDGLRLWSAVRDSSFEIGADSFIDLRDFAYEFPEFSQFDRAKTKNELQKQGWSKLSHPDACVDVFENRSMSVRSVVAVWGSGRGVVILSGLKKRTEASMNEIIQSLTLKSGSCRW